MKKGKLSIKINSANSHIVEYHSNNGVLWMDRNELCDLFGCYIKDIDHCLGEIFEKNILKVEDTCRYDIIAGSRRVSYDITAVNLTVIITIAFRLDTPEARTLRRWFVEQFTKMRSLEGLFLDIGEIFHLN